MLWGAFAAAAIVRRSLAQIDYQRNCDKQHAISGRLSSIDAISYAEIGAPVVAMRGVRLKGAKVHEARCTKETWGLRPRGCRASEAGRFFKDVPGLITNEDTR